MILRYTTIGIVTLLLLGGCQDRKSSEGTFVSKSLEEVVHRPASPSSSMPTAQSSQRTIPTASTDKLTQSNRASSMPDTGIEISDKRIVIDPHQARRFLEKLAMKFDKNIKKIETDLQHNHLQTQHPTGIVVTQDRIEIDLNKTEKFMEQWIKSVESIGRELDSAFRQFDRSLQPTESRNKKQRTP